MDAKAPSKIESEDIQGLDAEVAGSSDESKRTLLLISNDGKAFKVPEECTRISKIVRTTLQGDPGAERINLKTNAATLRFIVEYMNHCKGKHPANPTKPLKQNAFRMQDNVQDPWAADFIDRVGKDGTTIIAVLEAANYLNIPCLLELGCAKVASLLRSKTETEFKKVFSEYVLHGPGI